MKGGRDRHKTRTQNFQDRTKYLYFHFQSCKYHCKSIHLFCHMLCLLLILASQIFWFALKCAVSIYKCNSGFTCLFSCAYTSAHSRVHMHTHTHSYTCIAFFFPPKRKHEGEINLQGCVRMRQMSKTSLTVHFYIALYFKPLKHIQIRIFNKK